MKFNKKLVVTSLSTVLGLGIVGSITGTVAWYQYSTRGTASLIGVSAGESGVLQVKTGEGEWVRDVASSDFFQTTDSSAANYRADNKLRPCTWGGFTRDSALPTTGVYANPVLGIKEMTGWKPATSAVDYFQYTVKLQAINKSSGSNNKVELDVWLTDIVLQDAQDTNLTTNPITNALRMHLHIENGEYKKNILIAHDEVTGLDCHGPLDLDGDSLPDKVGGYDWNPERNRNVDYGHYVESGTYQHDVYLDNLGNEIEDDGVNVIDPSWIKVHEVDETKYVVDTTQQTAYGISQVKATTYDDTEREYTNGIKIGTTSDGEALTDLTITVTVWLEGWSQLDPYALPSTVKAIWDPSDTLGRTFYAGLTFDVGAKAFSR